MEEDIKILEEFIDAIGEEYEVVREKQVFERVINRYRELEKENQSYREYLGEPPCYDNAKYIPKSKAKEKIEEQIEEADDVLINKNYLDNFNGTLNEQIHYYNGYKDATLFIQELLSE